MTAFEAVCRIEDVAEELGIHEDALATIAAASKWTGKAYDALNDEWVAGIIDSQTYADCAVMLLEAYAAHRVRETVMSLVRRMP